jgi:tetratricopeptide (TPR) repeat protein
MLVAMTAVLGCAPGATAPPAQVSSAGTNDADLRARAKDDRVHERWREGEAEYAELERRHPDEAGFKFGRGIALSQLHRGDEAIAELERGVAIEDDATARYNLGLLYGGKGDFTTAIVHLARAVELKPDYPRAWSHLIDAAVRRRMDKQVLELVVTAREKCPSCAADPELRKMTASFVLFHHENAKRRFDQHDLEGSANQEALALLIDPTFADAHYNLGKVALARGDTAKAEEEYRKAVALYRPEEAQLAADAKNNLAFVLLAKPGGGPEAVALAREAIGVRGERSSYLDTLARACDVVKDASCARGAYEKLLKVDPATLPPEIVEHAKKRGAALGVK